MNIKEKWESMGTKAKTNTLFFSGLLGFVLFMRMSFAAPELTLIAMSILTLGAVLVALYKTIYACIASKEGKAR